ncbi:hypothetical protein [Curtobacterium sp. UCD-KPL2560]|uniref:hypothetical protein n=1 Tax=Curtobacterium sp. UCD-KPL2560 TaxID=1885315 RepID=UPI0008257518|nr:hypothetical protein [Curtobacterium sp. UCD-KPL2560]
MAGKTGYPTVANTDKMDGPAQITEVAKHFDDLIDFTVDDATKLPQSGNWVGRQARALDTRKVYVCTALPSTWVGEEAYATFSTLISGLPDRSYPNAGLITPVPTLTKNASWASIASDGSLVLAVGVYLISWDVGMGVAAVGTGRSGFVQISDSGGGRVARATVGTGEDSTTATGVLLQTSAGSVGFSLLKTGGGTPDVRGTIRVVKLA